MDLGNIEPRAVCRGRIKNFELVEVRSCPAKSYLKSLMELVEIQARWNGEKASDSRRRDIVESDLEEIGSQAEVDKLVR